MEHHEQRICRLTGPAILVILAILVICAMVPAVSAEPVTSVAKGDPYVLTGTATGNPGPGLAVWVFGNNYWTRDTVSVSGEVFRFELTGAKTATMAAGMYSVIVQHPMYNNQFDVDLSTNTPPGQTSVVSTNGQSFVIQGQAALPAPQAAGALIDMLNSPDIDDTCFTTRFFLEDPWIEPVEAGSQVYLVGSRITFSGHTNLAVGDVLLYSVAPSAFEPTSKEAPPETSGGAGQISVQPGSPRTFSFTIDTTGWTPGNYLVTVQNPESGYTFQAGVLLTDTPVPTHTAIQTATEGTPTQTATGTAAEPTQAGLSPIAVILALAVLVLLGRRDR